MLHGMWDLPGPGIEPVSPALAGGFLTTAPPGKSLRDYLTVPLLFLFESNFIIVRGLREKTTCILVVLKSYDRKLKYKASVFEEISHQYAICLITFVLFTV